MCRCIYSLISQMLAVNPFQVGIKRHSMWNHNQCGKHGIPFVVTLWRLGGQTVLRSGVSKHLKWKDNVFEILIFERFEKWWCYKTNVSLQYLPRCCLSFLKTVSSTHTSRQCCKNIQWTFWDLKDESSQSFWKLFRVLLSCVIFVYLYVFPCCSFSLIAI